MIRNATLADASEIVDIYNFYIQNTAITFEERPVNEAEIKTRITKVQDANLPWLVLIEEGAIQGYAYATRWRERSAYRFSVETTVYLSDSAKGRGYGTQLYQALLKQLKSAGLKIAIGGITLPNPASVALHEKLGMKKVAHFEKVGLKFENWQDVGYWQIDLSDD